jgi:hypothetical protein
MVGLDLLVTPIGLFKLYNSRGDKFLIQRESIQVLATGCFIHCQINIQRTIFVADGVASVNHVSANACIFEYREAHKIADFCAEGFHGIRDGLQDIVLALLFVKQLHGKCEFNFFNVHGVFQFKSVADGYSRCCSFAY